MNAKAVMESVPGYLKPEDTLREAAEKMRVCTHEGAPSGVKGMVVLDVAGCLVGLLSIKDILREIVPSYASYMRLGQFTWEGMLEDVARKIASRKVADVMNRRLVTVTEDAPLMECADLIVRHNLQRIPVVDASGAVVGIVYVRNLYYAIMTTLFGSDFCSI